MKKKSSTRSAFFNLRVLIGLCIVLAGVFLALVGLGTFSAVTANSAQAQPKRQKANSAQAQPKRQSPKILDIPGLPPGFDCAKIHELGIDKMEGLKWGLLMLKCSGEGSVGAPPSAFSRVVQKLLPPSLAPLSYGAADVDLVTGAETFPNTTQSETMVAANPDNPNQILIGFNDSRGANFSNFSGASFSSDGGTTFTRLTDPARSNQSPFSTTFGDPVVLYNKPTGTWFTVWLDGNGSCTLGGYKSTTPSDPSAASWTHFCVHMNGFDDRPSGWADNNPSSPHFGNLYVSWNDFNLVNANVVVSRSTDNGLTWSGEITVSTQGTFIRNVQITGDYTNGDLYIAGMDEGGGGFPHNDTNLFFKSTDGGATWTNTYTGSPFPGPGVTACSCNSYFSCMFTDNGGYWRHEGWGQPAVFNGIVSYVYDPHGAGADPADVYYIRSTDGGVTFSAPLKLNSDATTRPNWQPNLSVSPAGTLFTVWYDARESNSCTEGNPAVPCYRMWANKSANNGASWQGDMEFSDVVSPLPAEQDPNIFSCYAGDYDYGFALLQRHMTAWDDGRSVISGQSQQDAFSDRELVGFSVTTTNPACNSLINSQQTDFTVNLSDAADPNSVQPGDFTVNGTPADMANLSNGNQTIDFIFNSTPVVLGSNTMHIPAGAILRASDGMPIFEFLCNFCYDTAQLMVTTTNPPVGGTFSPPAPGDYTYDVNWNLPVDPASVSTSDLTLTGNAGGSVTNVQVINGNMTTEFTVHFNFGGSATANINAGAITAHTCNGNAAFTGMYSVEGCPPSDHYTITSITQAIVPGVTDIGNHCDDCTTTISLPFSYSLYDQTFSSVILSSNGVASFVTNVAPFTNECLPSTSYPTYTIFPYWDDLYTVFGGFGIFTTTEGTAPNRIFDIEWRDQYFPGTGTAHFELRLYEGQTRFDVVYGQVDNGNTSATAGVQKNSGAFDQYFCNGSGNPATGAQSYILTPCGTPSPTPTASPSPTSTATASPTPTPTPTCNPAGSFQVLIVSSDVGVQPVMLHNQIAAEPGVTVVDYFDASTGTPTLAQLQQYNIVVAFSNSTYADAVGMGNVLADYADTGGVVVAFEFDWYGPPFGLDGRWMTDGYTPFTYPASTDFVSSCLGSYNAGHPLMQNIPAGSLCALYRLTPSLTGGAVSVAQYQDGLQLCAYQVHNGHTGVGINAYVGDFADTWSGPFGTVVVNAGRWLLAQPCGTPSPTPTASPSPTPTPTCTPSWAAGPNLPTVLIRAVGVYFPDGNFYTMGGRTSDIAGSDFQHVLKYSPASNTWTQQGVTLADNTGNNMACGVLTVSGTPLIYCVGGSAAGQTTATARVYSYDPATDTQTVLTSGDNWPGDAAGTILPGGFAVANNKFYILGGFNINVASTNEIWQFDPTAAVGNKWQQMVNTPEGVMYAPTCTINGIIYLAGASDFQGGTVVDTTNSFSFNPAANTIGGIAAIPRATGETRGLTFNGKMLVMGGGRVAPNPSNEVDAYDPVSNTWTVNSPVTHFTNARRNFPTDTDGAARIWLAGGYEPSTPAADMEIFTECVSPTPTPTATATATATATSTPTPTNTPRSTPTPRPPPPPRPPIGR